MRVMVSSCGYSSVSLGLQTQLEHSWDRSSRIEHCWLALSGEDVLPALEGKGRTKGEGHGMSL